jgi:hypothetical protein
MSLLVLCYQYWIHFITLLFYCIFILLRPYFIFILLHYYYYYDYLFGIDLSVIFLCKHLTKQLHMLQIRQITKLPAAVRDKL